MIQVLQHVADVGFIALGALAVADWLRDRDPGRGMLAAALTLLATVIALGEIRDVIGDLGNLTTDLSVSAFAGSGFALVLYRHSFVPLRRRTLGELGTLTAALVILPFAMRPVGGAAVTDRGLVATALVLLLVAWTGCVIEPAVRLWWVAGSLPAVQAARMRALSGALLAIVAALVMTVGIGVAAAHDGNANGPLRLVEQLLLLGVIPVFAVSIQPPGWLRRSWRGREERSYRDAVEELLRTSHDRDQVAGSALSWAIRLFGAESAVLLSPVETLVAGVAVGERDLRFLRTRPAGSTRPWIERTRGSRARRLLLIPLRIEPQPTVIGVLAGRLTPSFGADELERAAEFAVSVAAAMELARTLDELERARARNETLLNAISASGEGLVITEAGRLVQANEAFCELSGYAVDELRELPSLLDLAPPSERVALRARLMTSRIGGDASGGHPAQLLTRDGRIVDVETVAREIPDGAGRQVFAIVRDVTERRRHELLRSMQFGVTSALNAAGSLAETAPRILEILGEALECSGAWLCVEDSGGRLAPAYRWQPWSAAVRGEGAAESPDAALDGALIEGVRKQNECLWTGVPGPGATALAFPVHADDAVTGVVVLQAPRSRHLDESVCDVLVDVGGRIGQQIERRRAEAALRTSVERLAQIASTDPLTGLSNRREFDRRLTGATHEEYAVIAIDVDNLKEINTDHTLEGGDLVLRAVAVTLSSLLRSCDILARVGGDEFAAILPGLGATDAAQVAERMRTAINSASMPLGRASISVGWVAAPAGADPSAVRAAAVDALLRAKSCGKDRVVGGESGSGPYRAGAADRDARLLGEMFTPNAMGVLYQPIIHLPSGGIAGYEALARPRGLPATAGVDGLFAAARRLGRAKDIDWLCRRTAFAHAPRLRRGTALFVNVSVAALLDPVHLPDQTLLALRWARLSPSRVVFEIGAREEVRDLERLRQVLAGYRDHGIRFALEGVTDAARWMQLLGAVQPEFLKVPGSAVPAGDDAATPADLIVAARAGGATLIATGVETQEAAAQVEATGFTLGQGYWFATPAAEPPLTSRSRRASAQQDLPLSLVGRALER